MTEENNATPDYLARFLIIARALEGAARAMAPLAPHEYELVLGCLTAQAAPVLDFLGPMSAREDEPAKIEESESDPAAPAKSKPGPKVVARPEGKRAPRGEWKRLVTEEINNRGIGGVISTADIGRMIGCSSAVASQRASALLKAGVLERKDRGSFEIKLLAIPAVATEESEGTEGEQA
jgi:hypothetical protein